MDQLTALDAGFLEAEDSDPHVSLAIGGMSIIAGPMPDFEVLVESVGRRIVSIPRCRQVLRTHLLDLAAPEWVDDPTPDLGHHVRRAALPAPGDDTALFRFAAEVMERRLDRDRPLWECWIVEGLTGDRWAMLMKVHHCIADGIATMNLLAGLSDDGAGESFATEIRAGREAAQRRSWRPSLSANPLDWAGGAWAVATAVTSTAALAIQGAVQLSSELLRPAPASALAGPVSAMRRYSAARVPLADVETICQTFGVTLNDVALSAITDSFRAALIRRGEKPSSNGVRVLVPVSVRSGDVGDGSGNEVSVMLPLLPVDVSDPVEQLQAVHRRLTRAKGSGQRQAGSAVVAAMNAVPFPLTAWAVRALTRVPQRSVVTLATNVPGPRHRLRIMGREVLQVTPIPPIALGLRTGFAMVSYADDLVFGITADFDATPDVDELSAGIEAAVSQLVGRCAVAKPRRARRRVRRTGI